MRHVQQLVVQEAHRPGDVFRTPADAGGGYEGQKRPGGLQLRVLDAQLLERGEERGGGVLADGQVVEVEEKEGVGAGDFQSGGGAEAGDDGVR